MEYFKDYEEFNETFKLAGEGNQNAMIDMLNYFSIITEDGLEPEIIRALRAVYIDKLVAEYSSVGWLKKGDYLLENVEDEEDINVALRCYLRAAMLGDTFGFDLIGDIYYRGVVYDYDFEMAWIFFWLSVKYSDAPNTLSLCRLGQMFKYGQRVEPDIEIAKEFFVYAIDVAGEYADIDDYAVLARHELADIG
jgi:TPR repeat protein